MLELLSFWTGSDKEDRRKTYAAEYNLRAALLEANALNTTTRIQQLVDFFEYTTRIKLTRYASGWRPAAVNDPTKLTGAAQHSNHLDANAGDVQDTRTGDLAWWCFNNQPALIKFGLYMEHPAATVLLAKATAWCHLSPIAPKSGLRAFHPSNNSLLTWNEYVADGGLSAGLPLALRKA